jgi:hypothetical protein
MLEVIRIVSTVCLLQRILQTGISVGTRIQYIMKSTKIRTVSNLKLRISVVTHTVYHEGNKHKIHDE